MKKEEFELKVKQGTIRKVEESVLTEYYVSIEGLVYSKSINTGKIRELKKSNSNGYELINMYHKIYHVHRLVALAFIPNPENKRCVNHIDGIKNNNHVSNLEWVTHKENVNHAIETGLFDTRKRNIESIRLLTMEQAKEIRELYDNRENTNISQRDLAEMYSVSGSTIKNILHNKTYRDDTLEVTITDPKDKRLLTLEEVREIRKLYANRKVEKITQKELAKKYSVSQKVIYCVVNNQTYREA